MSFLIASVSVSHRVEVVMSAGLTTAAVTMMITFFATCCSVSKNFTSFKFLSMKTEK